MSARPRNGLALQGGFNIGQIVRDLCSIRTVNPNSRSRLSRMQVDQQTYASPTFPIATTRRAC